MTKEDETEVQRLLKNVDVTELMDMLKKHGNRYSRRILKFFRWFCKYVPIVIMCFHAYGIWEFSQHPREMFIPHNENMPCYIFIYFMVYGFPKIKTLDYERKIFDECVSFLENGGLPYYDLNI